DREVIEGADDGERAERWRLGRDGHDDRSGGRRGSGARRRRGRLPRRARAAGGEEHNRQPHTTESRQLVEGHARPPSRLISGSSNDSAAGSGHYAERGKQEHVAYRVPDQRAQPPSASVITS